MRTQTTYEVGGHPEVYRSLSGYSGDQKDLYKAYEDVYYAQEYGFGHTRQPTPGERLGSDYEAWQDRALAASKQPLLGSSLGNRDLEIEDLSENLWQYWYFRIG